MRTLPTPVVSLWIAGVVCVPVSAQRTAPADIVGCYDVTEGEWRPDTSRVWEFEGQSPSTFGRFEMWYTIPPRIEVSAEEDWLSRERSLAPPLFSLTTPPDAIPAPHNRAWWRQQGDSIFLALSNGFVGVGARLRATSDGLTGQVTTRSDAGGTRPWHRDVRLESVACDSPPPVSIDAMEPLPRTVELVGGQRIEVGRPLTEALQVVGIRSSILRIVGQTTGLLASSDSVRATTTADGDVYHVDVYFFEPDAYDMLLARLREVLGPPHSEAVGAQWGNQMTEVLLRHWENGRTSVTLRDPRYRGR